MAATLTTGVELPEQSTALPGGLLDRSLDLPDGWENGVTVPFYGCGQPVLRDKCITAVDEPHRDGMEDFYPFLIEQGAVCSTVGGENLENHAVSRLNATTEWALGRQLQQDPANTGSPKLDDALASGTTSEITVAVAVLEEQAAATGFGTTWTIHAPVYAAAFLRRYNLLDDTYRTPAGGQWIISPGYERPTLDTIRLWVTGPVWAGVDSPEVYENVAHRRNDVAAWGRRAGLVAFDPCLNASVDVTGLCSTCGGAGGDGVA